MAVINMAPLEKTVRGRAIANSHNTEQDWMMLEQRNAEFNQQVSRVMGGEQEFIANSFQANYNDEAIMMAEKYLTQTRGMLSRDRFKPITYEDYVTDSFVTMHYRAGNPRIQKRMIRKIAYPNQDEIGRIIYDDLLDNDPYMNTYNGEYENPYAKEYDDSFMADVKWVEEGFDVGGAIEYYEEMNSLGIDNKMNDRLRQDVIEMNAVLEELLDAGIKPY